MRVLGESVSGWVSAWEWASESESESVTVWRGSGSGSGRRSRRGEDDDLGRHAAGRTVPVVLAVDFTVVDECSRLVERLVERESRIVHPGIPHHLATGHRGCACDHPSTKPNGPCRPRELWWVSGLKAKLITLTVTVARKCAIPASPRSREDSASSAGSALRTGSESNS